MVEEIKVPQEAVVEKKRIKNMTPEEKRSYNNAAKAQSRAREKEARKELRKEERSQKEVLEMGDTNESEKVRRLQAGKCFFGEVSPGVDARTLQEELQVVREMARALGIPDVERGEIHLDFIRRVFDAWVSYEGFRNHPEAHGDGAAPFLIRKTGTLTPGWGDYWSQLPFSKIWVVIPGSDKPVSLEAASSFEGESNG